ncbi:hypothetical protein B9Z19DRAFT_1082317 [Tuber borchii]|uniref:Uncharacterized protein n=1 Tax=Tuber borchii TaxID=42251 RepID=A0A2T6ZUK3_TUBBO|nr:hypothetical protein B9Z19DRAFT_1082317 [Tuber borchii]
MIQFVLKLISCEGLQFVCCFRPSNPSEHPEGSQRQPENAITRQPGPPRPMTAAITVPTGAAPRVQRSDRTSQTASAPSNSAA